jgi:hypothetical protein
MAPALAALKNTYGPKGLVLVGPTRLYGYAAGGEEAAPAAEKQYIDHVRRQHYSHADPHRRSGSGPLLPSRGSFGT